MASESQFLAKIKDLYQKSIDKLVEQSWFQELKSKWEELDHQSRLYLKYAAWGLVSLAGIIIVLTSVFSVRSLRNEVQDKQTLLTLIKNSNDEIRQLRDSSAGGGQNRDSSQTWEAYIYSTGQSIGVEQGVLTVGSERSPSGQGTELFKESLIDLDLKHVNIRQVVRLAHILETGARPIKLRAMTIDAQEDLSGYLNAKLTVSAFKPLASN